jgi:hypothetical protein
MRSFGMRPSPSGPHAIWFGLIFVAAGLAIVAGVWLDPGRAQAPVWVVEAAGAAFAFAGLSFVLEALGQRVPARLCSLAVVYLLAVPGLWTLFDSDASCTVGGAISGATFGGEASSWACRAVLGGGGIVVLLAALGFTLAAVLRRKAAAEEKSSQNPAG